MQLCFVWRLSPALSAGCLQPSSGPGSLFQGSEVLGVGTCACTCRRSQLPSIQMREGNAVLMKSSTSCLASNGGRQLLQPSENIASVLENSFQGYVPHFKLQCGICRVLLIRSSLMGEGGQQGIIRCQNVSPGGVAHRLINYLLPIPLGQTLAMICRIVPIYKTLKLEKSSRQAVVLILNLVCCKYSQHLIESLPYPFRDLQNKVWPVNYKQRAMCSRF